MKLLRNLLWLGLAAPLLCGQAHAITIYFAGSEDTAYTPIGSPFGGDTTAAARRSAFARAGVGISSTSAADPIAIRYQTPTFTSASNIWVHAQIYAPAITSTSGNQVLILRSPDGVSRIVLRQSGTAGTFKISTRTAAGTFTDLATASGAISAATLTVLDLNVNYTCSGAGGVTMYLAGVQVINFTGNPCTDAATQLNQLEFSAINSNSNTNNGCNNNSSCWSEVIVADSDTRGMALWTLQPVAAGNTQSWTPSTVANVNPTAINDTNFVTTGTNNALSEWTTPTATPAGTWGVLAVVQEARVVRGTTGPQNFDFLVRTKDGTDHTGGFSSTVSTSFGNFSDFIWATNPQTTTAWVTTDIATGFNLGIKSLP